MLPLSYLYPIITICLSYPYHIRVLPLSYLCLRVLHTLVVCLLRIVSVCGQIRVCRWPGVLDGLIACRLAQKYQTAA